MRYEFKNQKLLLQALTRPSALNEGRQSREIEDFQRLEFIGDKVLNLIISDILMEHHPIWSEGQLTQETAKYVNNSGPLSVVARNLGLNNFLIMGRGEELNNNARDNDKVLSDATEALIGALWLDSNRNYGFLKDFIIEHWRLLGLMPTVHYRELAEIILDDKTPIAKRIEQFQEAFSQFIDSQTLNSIIELAVDVPELFAIVLTKPIEKNRLNEILAECVRLGRSMQVEMLLKKGSDATIIYDNETLLQYAVTCHYKESPQIVELLLQYHADPNWKRGKVKEIRFKNEISYGRLLAYLGNKTSVETIEYEYSDANTALHWLVLDDNVGDSNQQLRIMRILLKYGANPNLKNEEHKIPLHIICENFYQTEANADIVHELVLAKSNVNSQDNRGNTPLHSLLIHYMGGLDKEFKVLDTVESLLTSDFNVDGQNEDGNTVLHLAYFWLAEHKSTPAFVWVSNEIVKMILSKNPNKRLENRQGITVDYFQKINRIDEKVLTEIPSFDSSFFKPRPNIENEAAISLELAPPPISDHELN